MATPSWADTVLDDAGADLIALDAVASQLEAVQATLRAVVRDATNAATTLQGVTTDEAGDVLLARARNYENAAAYHALSAYHDLRDLELAVRAIRRTLRTHHERLRAGRPRREVKQVA